jgi:hypothetical protein
MLKANRPLVYRLLAIDSWLFYHHDRFLFYSGGR